MRILLLGGTQFLGRHLTEAALARGHDVTLFHRTATDLYPEADHCLGDRTEGYAALGEDRWDAVIDVWACYPSLVTSALDALENRVGRYFYVSSISVYADFASAGLHEDSPVQDPAGLDLEAETMETYGPRKVACERAVRERLGDRALIVRPGLIVGPHDPSDRFTYWPRRLAADGHVVAPDHPEVPVQLIDARDLAAWMIQALEAELTGTFNATGPDTPLTMEECLETCAEAVSGAVELVWIPETELLAAEVAPWTDLPLWVPASMAGHSQVDNQKAIEAGLKFRPLEETARATLAWDQERGSPALKMGLDAEREHGLLSQFGG